VLDRVQRRERSCAEQPPSRPVRLTGWPSEPRRSPSALILSLFDIATLDGFESH
jgi:hypothetical protein